MAQVPAFAVGVPLFFCQAEDGIRDLVRSRGLGDVYKRQAPLRSVDVARSRHPGESRDDGIRLVFARRLRLQPVSYTHLTLPTSDLV